MPDKFELARGWFLKAESDLNTARLMVESSADVAAVWLRLRPFPWA
jgi:hypothetical protein